MTQGGIPWTGGSALADKGFPRPHQEKDSGGADDLLVAEEIMPHVAHHRDPDGNKFRALFPFFEKPADGRKKNAHISDSTSDPQIHKGVQPFIVGTGKHSAPPPLPVQLFLEKTAHVGGKAIRAAAEKLAEKAALPIRLDPNGPGGAAVISPIFIKEKIVIGAL